MTRRWAVGIDFGGTNIKLGLVSPSGRVTASAILSAKQVGRPQAFVPAAADAVKRLAASAGLTLRQLCGIGVGAPGPVDAGRGIVHLLVNVPGWREVPLKRLLERRTGCPCAVDNDANLYALGEWRFGAGRRAQHMVALTLGTGVGGGVILGGELYHGVSGAAGEIGHMPLDPDGPRCGCGARGCLEAHVGTAAIVRLARAAIRRGSPRLTRLARAAGGRITPALVSQAASQGDRAAREVWAAVGASLGTGIAGVINLLNPERIVIGGGVAKAWRWFAPAMRAAVHAHAMGVPARAAAIVRAKLGDEAGILGAAAAVCRDQQ